MADNLDTISKYAERVKAAFIKLGMTVPANGNRPIYSPYDGGLIAFIQDDTVETVNQKIEKAKLAQAKAAKIPAEQLEDLLLQFAQEITDNAEALTEIIVIDGGKLPSYGATQGEGAGEVGNVAFVIKDTVATIRKNRADQQRIFEQYKIDKGFQLRNDRVPVGVVAILGPFNFPVMIATGWDAAPAVASGNAVIIKPSEKNPLTLMAYEGLFHKVLAKSGLDVPAELFTVVNGDIKVGQALLKNESVDKIVATGSTKLIQVIEETLKHKQNNKEPFIGEGGGSNGTYIAEQQTEDSLQIAEDSVMFFRNGGPKCTLHKRVFVHQSQYAEFYTRIDAKVTAGNNSGWTKNGLEEESKIAPIIDGIEAAKFEKYLEDASALGLRVKGGDRVSANAYPNAYFYNPAIIAFNNYPTAEQREFLQKECFGPVIVMAPVRSFEEGVELVNEPESATLVARFFGDLEKCAAEVEEFYAKSKAGHTLVNQVVNNPLHGHTGFGCGQNGEVLGDNPTFAFTKQGAIRRLAINVGIPAPATGRVA